METASGSERRETLGEAVRYLAGRCDWAQTDDGVGFSASDTGLGHWLAERPEAEWTPAQRRAAWEMLAKYREQLASAGIEYEGLEEPPVPEGVAEERVRKRAQGERRQANRGQEPGQRVERGEGGRWVIRFPYDRELVAVVKETVDGRRWDSDEKRWTAPDTELAAAGVLELVREHGFAISEVDREHAEQAAGKVEELGIRYVEMSGDGDELHVVFPYDERQKDELKRRVPGARWSGEVWTVPVDEADELSGFVEDEGFSVTSEARQVMEEAAEQAERLREASEASDAELEVRGRLGGELRPFQRAGVRYAAEAERVMIADEMGLGKTIEALAALEHRGTFPAVVAMPASLKRNWKREAEKWLPERTVEMVEGTDPHPTRADVVLVNYAVLGNRVDVENRETGKTEERYPWVEQLRERDLQAVVLDESHYVKNGDSNRATAAMRLVEGVRVRLLLTGTPVLNRPAELIHQLKVLGRFREVGGNWKRFVTRYCNGHRTRWGWDVSGASNLSELNAKLRASCYVRRKKEDVLSELPAKQRAVVPVEVTNRAEYDAAREDVVAWLAKQGKRAKADAATRAEALARVNYLKQLAAEGKMKAAVEWVRDFLQSGEKLVLFAHHRSVQEELYEAFADRAVRVTGGDDSEERQRAVDRFQTDDEVRLMVGSLKAAGVGLTLTAASHVAFAELGWTPADHDQAEDRVHRIGQADAVTAWYLLAEDTIDEEIHELIERKRDVVQRTTEGGEDEGQQSVLGELMATMREEAAAE